MINRCIRGPLTVAGLASALFAGPVHADTYKIDVTGILSQGAWGDADNTVLYLNLGAFNEITSISSDLYVTAYAPNLLTELSVHLNPTTTNSVGGGIAPAFRQYYSGTWHSYGTLDLAAYGLAFSVAEDGLLKVEFSNASNHIAGGPEGSWDSGWISFETKNPIPSAVPEPSSYAMMALGLVGMGATFRRRRLQA